MTWETRNHGRLYRRQTVGNPATTSPDDDPFPEDAYENLVRAIHEWENLQWTPTWPWPSYADILEPDQLDVCIDVSEYL